MISDFEEPLLVSVSTQEPLFDSVAIKEPSIDPVSTQEPTMVCYYINNYDNDHIIYIDTIYLILMI